MFVDLMPTSVHLGIECPSLLNYCAASGSMTVVVTLHNNLCSQNNTNTLRLPQSKRWLGSFQAPQLVILLFLSGGLTLFT